MINWYVCPHCLCECRLLMFILKWIIICLSECEQLCVWIWQIVQVCVYKIGLLICVCETYFWPCPLRPAITQSTHIFDIWLRRWEYFCSAIVILSSVFRINDNKFNPGPAALRWILDPYSTNFSGPFLSSKPNIYNSTVTYTKIFVYWSFSSVFLLLILLRFCSFAAVSLNPVISH